MPTIKQQDTFNEVVSNRVSIREGMRRVYKSGTANNTDNLTKSKGWQQLMDEHLADTVLAKKHGDFLHSKREDIGVKALDMAYKLKGSYAPEKTVSAVITGNIKDFAKTDAIRAEYEAKLLKEYQDGEAVQ